VEAVVAVVVAVAVVVVAISTSPQIVKSVPLFIYILCSEKQIGYHYTVQSRAQASGLCPRFLFCSSSKKLPEIPEKRWCTTEARHWFHRIICPCYLHSLQTHGLQLVECRLYDFVHFLFPVDIYSEWINYLSEPNIGQKVQVLNNAL